MTAPIDLSAARVGWFVDVRLEIDEVDVGSAFPILSGGLWIRASSILAIHPPPETEVERLTRELAERDARIAELEEKVKP